MKRLLYSASLLVLLCSLTGCKSKQEALADDGIAVMNDLCDILDGVTDEASAKAAVPKIEALGPRLKDLAERQKALGTATKEEQEKVQKKMTEHMEKMKQRLQTNGQKMLQYPVLFQAFMKSVQGAGGMPPAFGAPGAGEFKPSGPRK